MAYINQDIQTYESIAISCKQKIDYFTELWQFSAHYYEYHIYQYSDREMEVIFVSIFENMITINETN